MKHYPETTLNYEYYVIGDWVFYPVRPKHWEESRKYPREYRMIELLFGSGDSKWRKGV